MQKMSDVVRAAKITTVVTSALLMCAGIFIVFWNDKNPEVIRFLVGIVCGLMGATRIFGYFSNDLYRLAFQTGFAEGVFGVVIGILILLTPNGLFSVFPYIAGIYVLLDGMLKLQTAIDAREFGMNNWRILILSAVAVITIGIVSLVLPSYGIVTKRLIGIALFAVGAENMWETMYTVRVRTKRQLSPGDLPEEVLEIAKNDP